ncbi:MAG: hypothetical protein NT040_08755 [Bacteroidetes bacterium]|nr:hypothetical protein [Bacteroidota bacterium]
MSTSKTNLLTHGFRGKVGNQYVMKNRNGKQIIAAKPDASTKAYSEAQLAARKQFAEATAYAKGIMKKPELKAAYAARGEGHVSAYAAAVTDFYKLPWISSIETERYSGKTGDIVNVSAGDYFRVVEVAVTITNAAGQEIERGQCVKNDVTNKWEYTATVENPDKAGTTIKAFVRDLPDHRVEASVVL